MLLISWCRARMKANWAVSILMGTTEYGFCKTSWILEYQVSNKNKFQRGVLEVWVWDFDSLSGLSFPGRRTERYDGEWKYSINRTGCRSQDNSVSAMPFELNNNNNKTRGFDKNSDMMFRYHMFWNRFNNTINQKTKTMLIIQLYINWVSFIDIELIIQSEYILDWFNLHLN